MFHARLGSAFVFFPRVHPRPIDFEAAEQLFRVSPPMAPKKSMAAISASRLRNRATWPEVRLPYRWLPYGAVLRERARLLGDLRVIGVTRPIEQRAHLLVGQPVDQAGFAEECFTAPFEDLAQQPLEVLLRSSFIGSACTAFFTATAPIPAAGARS